jgi:hypothetical protein
MARMGFVMLLQSERHNGMEAATLSLLLTFIFLGLMNPTDLSLAVLDSSGALVLPHDTTITVGTLVVCSMPPIIFLFSTIKPHPTGHHYIAACQFPLVTYVQTIYSSAIRFAF